MSGPDRAFVCCSCEGQVRAPAEFGTGCARGLAHDIEIDTNRVLATAKASSDRADALPDILNDRDGHGTQLRLALDQFLTGRVPAEELHVKP